MEPKGEPAEQHADSDQYGEVVDTTKQPKASTSQDQSVASTSADGAGVAGFEGKDLGHFWLGYIRMLGHLQMSAHLVDFDRL